MRIHARIVLHSAVVVVFPLGVLFAQTTSESDTNRSRRDGDEAFFRIDYPAAVSAYESWLRQSPEDPAVLWRLSRTYVCMGEVADEEERDALYRKGEVYARRCTRADSLSVEGHTWLAGAIGYLALYAGPGDQIRLSHELTREVEGALRLNPSNDIAYSIKGSFYRALGNVGWLKKQLAALFLGEVPRGGYPEAEEALRNAVRIAPDVMRHHYELGVLYLDMKRREDAKRILENASTLPIRIASDRPRLEKIRELLSGLFPPAGEAAH